MTYKGFELYQAFGGARIAAKRIWTGEVLGYFTSLDEAMRAIDRLYETGSA
jgi:hypothetical protein